MPEKTLGKEDVLNILKEKGIPLNKLKKGGCAKHTQGCGHNLNKCKEYEFYKETMGWGGGDALIIFKKRG